MITPSHPPIRVALLDDHKLLLDTLAATIRKDPGMEVVCTATTAEEGLRRIFETAPDVAILDVDLPGGGSFNVAQEVRLKLKKTRVMFLTGFLSDVLLEQALRLKSFGYLVKDEPVEVVLEAVRQVARGKHCFSRQVQERIDYDENRRRYKLHVAHPLADLTTRQLEVLRHLARGASVKDVALTMHLSEKSVDSHKYRIMNKLDIHDRVELARYAIREGLLLP